MHTPLPRPGLLGSGMQHPAKSWGFSPLDAVSGHRPPLECPEFSAPVFLHEVFPKHRDGVRRESGCDCSAGVERLLGFSPWEREVRIQDAPQASGLGMTPHFRPPGTGERDQGELGSEGSRLAGWRG